MEQEFIILTADAEGKLDGAAFYRAPAEDGFKAGRSRAVLSGSQQFWVYRVVQNAPGSKESTLAFEPVAKAADKKSAAPDATAENAPAKKPTKKAK